MSDYIVSAPCKGVRDGEVYPTKLNKGDKVSGELGLALYNAGFAEKPNAGKRKDSTASRAGDAGGGKKSPSPRRKGKPSKSS